MSIAWLRNRFADLKYFFWLFKNWYNLKKDGYSLAPFLSYWILYFLSRLFYGKNKSIDISKNIISRFKNNNLIIPLPIKNKPYCYIGLRDSSDFYMFREVCINDDYNISRIKLGIVIVDVGAHVGTFTLLASKIVGEKGKVIAIEPEPKNYKQLIENIKLNNFLNVNPLNIALGDYNGFGKLYISYSPQCHSLLFKEDKISSIEVLLKTLDNLLEELNLKKIDVIKIDVEGAEILVLKGAEKTLKANPNIKIIVAAEHYPSEAKEVCQFLNDRGFKTKVSQDNIVMTI